MPRRFDQGNQQDGEIEDLSSLAVSSKDRGLQITIALPPKIEEALDQGAFTTLESVGQTHLSNVLVEAQRVAAGSSKTLGLAITSEHVHQAEGIEMRRRGNRRAAMHYLRDISLAGVGAGLGLIPTSLPWAMGVVVVSMVLFHFLDKQS
jgi:hypothetical protein